MFAAEDPDMARTALALTFTEDPLSGMGTEKFGGAAVSFVSSVKFGASRK